MKLLNKVKDIILTYKTNILIGILILIPILLFLFFHKKEADITVDAELAAHNRKSGKRRLFDY